MLIEPAIATRRFPGSRGIIALAFAVLVATGFGCSGRNVAADRSDLEAGIALYIDGQFEAAVERLEPLPGRLESDEDILTAWLYLGRSYEALEDWVAAADAYSTGRMLGGGVRFDSHLATAQAHLRAAPRKIQTQKSVTRAELAALFVEYGGFETGPEIDAPDMKGHWASTYAAAVWSRGIMEIMPDGGFHPDAPVTQAAFYSIMTRASNVMRVPPAVLDAWYPGGYVTVLQNADAPVTGSDATDILTTIAEAAGE